MCACILVSRADVDATLAGPQPNRLVAESKGGKGITRMTQLSQPNFFYAASRTLCSVTRYISVSARIKLERLPAKSRPVKGFR